MKEIEVKLKINDLSYKDLLKMLERYIITEEKQQIDVIFLQKEQVGKPISSGSKVYRIRTTTKNGVIRHLFTLKVQTDRPLVSNEYEFEISNPTTAKKVLLESGLVERVRVAKRRTEGRLANYNLCIDEVEKLGIFIELETFSNKKPDTIQSEMINQLKTLDIEGEICMTPYDTQIERLQNE